MNEDRGDSTPRMNRWEAWSNYREIITKQFKIKVLKDREVKSIIILGSGNCDDLDLSEICKTAEKIIMVDIDIESTKKGIEKQNLPSEIKNKIELIGGVDLTSLSNYNFFEEYFSLLRNNCSIKQIKKLFRNAASKLNSKEETILADLKGSFDCVISGAVHSQLLAPTLYPFQEDIYNLFDNVTLSYSYEDIKEIKEELDYLYIAVAKYYNRLLLSLRAPEGVLFTWLDMLKFQYDSPGHKLAVNALKKQDIKTIFDMLNDFSVNGSVQGFNNLLDLYNIEDVGELSRLNMTYFLWPFHFTKVYMVFSFIIEN